MAKLRLFDRLDNFKHVPEIIAGYERGEKVEALAAQYGYHHATIHRIARRYGATVRKRGRPKRRR
jgi:hypothetical protein